MSVTTRPTEAGRYLEAAAAELGGAADDRPDVQPLVRTARGSDPLPFSTWADFTSRGLLEAPGESGKTFVLNRYTLARLHRAAEDPALLMPVRVCLTDPPDPEAPLDAIRASPATADAPIEDWACRGDLVFVIDGIEDLAAEAHARAVDWVLRLRIAYPANRFILASRKGTFSQGWDRAELTAEIRPVRAEAEAGAGLAKGTAWRAVSALIRAVDANLETSDAVRWDAAVSLERNDHRAVDALLRSLDPQREASVRVRKFAAKALGRLGEGWIVGELIRSFESPAEEAGDVREGIAEALGRLGGPAAVDTLVRHLEPAVEADERVRGAVARALELALTIPPADTARA